MQTSSFSSPANMAVVLILNCKNVCSMEKAVLPCCVRAGRNYSNAPSTDLSAYDLQPAELPHAEDSRVLFSQWPCQWGAGSVPVHVNSVYVQRC